MKYIQQLDRSYFAASKELDCYKVASSLPKDQRAVVFLPETNKKVQVHSAL